MKSRAVQLVNALRVAAGNASEVLMRAWLAEHGEELIECLAEVETKRARFLLYELCEKVPAVAGVVTMLMRGTPEQAVNNIGMFSPDLAERLRPHLAAMAALQTEWTRVEPEPMDGVRGGVLAIGSRVYHRHRDLFGKIVTMDYGIPQTAMVKYELPWDPKAPPEAVPVSELAHASEWE